MKILYLEWDAFGNKYIKDAFTNLGHNLVIFDFPRKTEDTRRSEVLASKVTEAILSSGADIVFSLNYFPVVAIASYACKRKYVSWTYDSPYIQLYSKTIDLPSNYAFIFDKSEYMKLKSIGADRVFFLPMAADVSYYDSIQITDNERKLFSADIAMIGSMYTEKKHDFMRHLKDLDDYTKGYINGLIEAQKNVYGMSLFEKGLDEKIISRIQKVCPIDTLGDGYETPAWVFANYFLARHLTAIERTEFIEALSENFNVSIYTPEKTDNLKAENRGQVEYYKDFPKAVKCAKINLNISLRSIVSGIPLRAMDIMGCGGFLLTNYQSDFDDFFVAGEDYMYYESKNDLVDKAAYYLEHEDERMKIAASGHNKMKLSHTYTERIKQILSMI